ncbi:UPF0461 protein C5orf24 homolog [Pollicipes pollicipes]|uniref:UPF0461 protein C5orf24 homolog n=1 Tax=Pollicipes pollicipes TaxID=41117 RepID=UPI00188589FC|nr:UPF0461 protein C5orf24 homolog [Pollicipes pollicipes]
MLYGPGASVLPPHGCPPQLGGEPASAAACDLLWGPLTAPPDPQASPHYPHYYAYQSYPVHGYCPSYSSPLPPSAPSYCAPPSAPADPPGYVCLTPLTPLTPAPRSPPRSEPESGEKKRRGRKKGQTRDSGAWTANKRLGRPLGTTRANGYKVGCRGGRRKGTTRENGFKVSGGRPRGTTRANGYKVSTGRPKGTTVANGYKCSSGRPRASATSGPDSGPGAVCLKHSDSPAGSNFGVEQRGDGEMHESPHNTGDDRAPSPDISSCPEEISNSTWMPPKIDGALSLDLHSSLCEPEEPVPTVILSPNAAPLLALPPDDGGAALPSSAAAASASTLDFTAAPLMPI